MLYPQRNKYRHFVDLSGFWDFRLDRDDKGVGENWREHVWNMCDFKTSQGITRMGSMNYKGVFTRDRRPKMAAHMLRMLWKEKENSSTEDIKSLRNRARTTEESWEIFKQSRREDRELES